MRLLFKARGKEFLLNDLADGRMQVILGNPHRQYLLGSTGAMLVKSSLFAMGVLIPVATVILIADFLYEIKSGPQEVWP